ncbi:MAG: hypothetical protein ACO3P1_13625 [Pseudomonadales bacterium]|jgi:hypothetical protein
MNEIEALRLAYRRTFNTEDGERVLKDLRKRLRFEQTTHVPGDPNESAFLEGQRYAFLLIAGMLSEEREQVRKS